MRVLLYAKVLKKTKPEETIVFLVTFLSLVAFQLGWEWGGGPPAPPPPGYAYAELTLKLLTMQEVLCCQQF